MYEQRYQIALTNFTFLTENELKVIERMKPFLGTCRGEEIRITYRSADILPSHIESEKLYQGIEFDIYQDHEKKEYRIFKTFDGREYAVLQYDMQQKEGTLLYDRQEHDLINHGAACLRFAAFEQMMLSADRILLHAACVQTDLGGILFSGVSGIGKSTQAELWMKHRGATMINGDRPVLFGEEDQWFAAGSPYAGSSHCYVNAVTPIKGIVFLQKAQTNSVRRLTPGESFLHIYRNVVANTWNQYYMDKMVDLIKKMAEVIPCYSFACTPDEEAVNYLEQYLSREEG